MLGDTGPAGRWYYDKITHTIHDYDEYWDGKPMPINSSKQMEF